MVTKRKLVEWSRSMLTSYDKGNDHINAWDTKHFVTLMASCGFEFIDYLPTEGVPINFFVRKAAYVDQANRGIFKNLCYTQQFIFKKAAYVEIDNMM